MSALEQIRKRPALIISILGLALLLFILTAISNPEKLFSDPSTIAKIDGEKIDYNQFHERHHMLVENEDRQAKASGQSRKTDNAILEMQAMESIINEVLLSKKMEKLGITVTDGEVSELIKNNHPIVMQYVQGLGFPDAMTFYNFAFEPQNNGIDGQSAQMLRDYWMQMENSIRQQLLNNKYQAIFGYTLVPNQAEARDYFNETQTVDTIRYVRLLPSVISDAEAALTDEDINALYEEEKNRFASAEKQNLVNYIKVNVVPSEADRAQAIADVEEAMNGLRTMPGTEGVYNNLKFIVENYNTSAANLPAGIAARLDQLKTDSVMQISFYDNVYTLAKYLGSSKATDKIKFDALVVSDPDQTDSIVALLNGGVAVDSIANLLGQQMPDQEVSLLDPQMGGVAPTFEATETGVYFAPGTDHGFPRGVIYRINSKEAPVDVYEVAEIKYTLEPSNATISDLRNALNEYINKNYTAAQFADSASAAGYRVVPARVSKSSLSIDNVPETRALAKWAANSANKGQVSEITSDSGNTYFIAAAVSDVYDGDYIPATDPFVKRVLTPKALARKKINMLMERYGDKGADLEAFAAATNLPVETAALSFSGNVNPILSADGALLGLVAATPVGQYVAPTPTDLSVIAFEKTASQAPAREFIEELDMNEFAGHMGHPYYSPYNAQHILRHGKDIDNRIQKFTND